MPRGVLRSTTPWEIHPSENYVLREVLSPHPLAAPSLRGCVNLPSTMRELLDGVEVASLSVVGVLLDDVLKTAAHVSTIVNISLSSSWTCSPWTHVPVAMTCYEVTGMISIPLIATFALVPCSSIFSSNVSCASFVSCKPRLRLELKLCPDFSDHTAPPNLAIFHVSDRCAFCPMHLVMETSSYTPQSCIAQRFSAVPTNAPRHLPDGGHETHTRFDGILETDIGNTVFHTVHDNSETGELDPIWDGTSRNHLVTRSIGT